MSKTIWLIAEDKSDRQILEAILQAKDISITVRIREPDGKTGGVSRLAYQLESLIKTVHEQKSEDDCIVVLHDTDHKTRTHDRKDYEQIEEICARYADVVHIVARDEIESWLLADAGLCKWLNINHRNWDEQRKPSVELDRALKRAGKNRYQSRYLAEILKQIDGTGDQYSPSMQLAFQVLKDAGCI